MVVDYFREKYRIIIMNLQQINVKANATGTLFLFYKNIMELPVVYIDACRMEVKAGASKLIFEESNEVKDPVYHLAFNIPSNKFDEAFKWMKAKLPLLFIKDYDGYVAEFTNWNARSFYFEDPAGNILEIIARADLHDHVDEPFSSALIRNISEIGLVFSNEDFDEQVRGFMQNHDLSYFDKQPPMPHFRAVGDHEGLFIIVPEDRVWYPTENKRSKLAPMEIHFSSGKNKGIFARK